MPRFRDQKKLYLELCAREDWKKLLDKAIAGPEEARAAVNAFLALLPRPEYRWQAVYGLGLCLPLLVADNMESARVFMRRLMWSLNEESGNLGWGIPEAMGAILGASPALAGEYARIFLSYGYETGKDDNFLDHAPLRRGVYWGIGRLAQGNRAAALPALPHLAAALQDDDAAVRGMAAWATLQLALPGNGRQPDAPQDEWRKVLDALQRATETPGGQTAIELFDGREVRRLPLADILAETAEAVAGRVRGARPIE